MALGALVGCASGAPARPTRGRPHANAWPAITALELGDFGGAWRSADAALAIEGRNAQARVVRAVCKAADGYAHLLGSIDGPRALDMAPASVVRTALERLDQRLAWADLDLAAAEWDPAFELELCPACWHDVPRWRDLLEAQADLAGQALPAGDERRLARFRFDAGDIVWARGAIASQRAAVSLILAQDPAQAPERRRVARQLLGDAEAHAARARRLFLAETDDDREWIPGPQQHRTSAAPLIERLRQAVAVTRAAGTTAPELLRQVLW